MTVSTTQIRVSYTGDGTSTNFTIPFPFFLATDLEVLLAGSPISSGFSVTGGNGAVGTLIMVAAPATGVNVQIILNDPLTQLVNLVDGTAFPSATLNQVNDRIVQIALRLQDQISRSIRAPDGDVSPALLLPAAATRASTFLGFDSSGNASLLALLPTALTQSLFNAFLGLSPPYVQTTQEASGGYVPVNPFYPPGNALRWGADSTGASDSTAALQTWIDASYQSKVDAYLPGGTYTISSVLILNRSDQTLYRGRAFRVYGNGAGPVFVTPGSSGEGTSVIRSSVDTTLMRYQQYLGAVTTSGNYYVSGLRFEANSSIAAVQLDVLGEYSVFSRCEIFQSGVGDGLRCLELTKGTIEQNNVLNRDWNTAALGAARVGCGINIFSQYNAGLGTVRKNTSRGFKDAYVFGDGSHDLSAMAVYDNECSVVYRGMTIGATMSKCALVHNYFEGVELTLITDLGRYSVVRDNISQGGTWTTGIDGSAQGGGCIYDGNEIGLPPGQSNVTGITVAGTANVPCQVTNNQVIWGSSGTGLSNVVGINLSGVDAMIRHDGNMLNPNGGWSGASNCNAFVDSTTSSTGSSGDGTRGFGQAQDSSTLFPRMCRGAFGLWRNATALGNSALASNVLTLGAATYVVWNPTSGTLTVNSINATVCEEGHVYKLRIVNNTGNTLTLTTGASLRVGATNITQSNNTAWTYEFFMDANGAWLASAPVQNF